MDETGRTPTRRRALIAAAAVALALAGVVGAVVLLSSPSHPQHHVAGAAPIIVAVTPTPPPLPPSTSAPPPEPGVPHDRVAPAAPTRFTLRGSDFTIHAHVCAMAPVFPLDPPGEQHHTVCWVTKGFGYRPSSHSRTSYVLGHSWAQDPLEVLNAASVRATRDILHAKVHHLDGVPIYPARSLLGSRITLRTPRGTLVYVVRNAFGVDKMRLGGIDSIMDPQVRNRVVLITCAELGGVDYHYNVILDARLVASRAG
ncbi:MAG TPA: hypothetical protein VE442_09430 [Jatrophihabitans sp.]|jgi:hypothetical protein|nr:hypothetical protein [Jatrophihabitans sp.]